MYNALALQNGPQQSYAVWASASNLPGGFPCTLAVQGASSNNGSLTIQDRQGNIVWTTQGLALPQISSIAAGQALATGTKLYSPNGHYFITILNYGDLVICAKPLHAAINSNCYTCLVFPADVRAVSRIWGNGSGIVLCCRQHSPLLQHWLHLQWVLPGCSICDGNIIQILALPLQSPSWPGECTEGAPGAAVVANRLQGWLQSSA